MRIAVYGLGYVGLTASACLARQGHEVVGIEIAEAKVAEVNRGRSPIAEPGLADLISDSVSSGKLSAVRETGDRLATCEMAIVCVGTPSAPDGSHNMAYIAEVSRQIAEASRGRERQLTVVYRSTIRPGSMAEMIGPIFADAFGADYRSAIELVYNPEFLREATAIKDYFSPPKIVIGTHDGGVSETMQRLYAGIDAPTFYTGFAEAEFTKFVDNTWHAVKVAFANEIGRTCVKIGVSAAKVHEMFVSDTKLNISANYTRPGGAFGGSCLPKDVRALQYIAGDVGASTPLVDSLLRSNDAHKHFLFEYVTAGLVRGATILMSGLAFKANSDDLRESPNVDLARKLLTAGFQLSVYDPALVPAKLIGQNLGYAYSQLPKLSQLLVSKEQAESRTWDLAIDSSGILAQLSVRAGRTLSTNSLP